jgi:O-antigen/teichoic acid export membrane protein
MTQEGSAGRIVRNTLANGLGQFLSVAIGLILTPFVIDEVGAAAYGVFILALTFTFFGGYAGLADLGVEGAAVRFIAESRSKRDWEAMNAAASTAFVFFSAMALVLTPLLVLLATVLVDVFDVPPELEPAAAWCFVLVAAQMLLELPARTFFAVLEGSQRFTVYQAIEVARALFQGALWVVVLLTDRGIVALTASTLCASLLVVFLGWLLAHRVERRLSVSPFRATRPMLRRLLTYGSGFLLLRLMYTSYRQMGRVIVGAALGVRAVTPYEVANKVHLGAATVMNVAVSALLPASAYARDQRQVLRDMYLRGTSYTVAAVMPVILAGFIFAEPLIRTWVGEAIADDATTATRLFFVYLALIIFQQVGTTAVTGLGRLRPLLLITAGTLLVNLGASIALVGDLGIDGVVLGTVIANALAWPALVVFFMRVFGVDAGEWVAGILVPNLPGIVTQVVTAPFLFALADDAGNLAVVAALFLLSVAISGVAYLTVGLRGEPRRVLLNTLREAVGMRSS